MPAPVLGTGGNDTEGALAAEDSLPVQAVHLRAVPKLKSRARASGRGRVSNRVGGYRVNEGAEAMEKRSATCTESFPAPQRGSRVCPSSCPFMRFDPDKICHWKCITEEHCLTAPNMPSSIADRKTGMCVVCQVPGCAECANDAHHCARCHKDFDLQDGVCSPHTRHTWRAIYAVLGVLVLVVLWYVIALAFRPVVNEEVLAEALAHRSMAKTRHDEEGHGFYSLATDLTSVMTNGGVGVLLHFRYQWMVLLWSLLALLVFGFAAAWNGRLRAADVLVMQPTHDEALHACLHVDAGEAVALETMRLHFLYATGVMYVLSTAGAIWLATTQKRKYQEVEDKTTTMADFALWCSGFPAESWSEGAEGHRGLEEEYTSFFRNSAWGDSVVGTSVIWDLAPLRDAVDKTLNDSLHALDKGRSRRLLVSSTGEEIGESQDEAPTPQPPQPAISEQSQKGRLAKWARLECVDELWWPSTEEAPQEAEAEAAQDCLAAIQGMRTTGSVFVVFRTEGELHTALETPLPKFRGEWEIEVQHLECEPETVLWDGFSVSNRERFWRIVRGIGIIALTVVVWCVCFYGPYAYYIVSWQKVAGSSQGGAWEGLLLGLVITVGNQIVYAQCSSVAEGAEFSNRDNRDMLNVLLYTTAVLINTLVDLWLITIMAHGWQQDSGVDSKAVIRNPSVQHALFVQLVAYMYPSTLLLPFLLEPVVTAALPYFLGKWLIRSRPGISRWEAEQGLDCPPFDLNRYGDIVINLVLVIVLFFLTSVNMWWACFTMLTSCFVILVWDHCRFLRLSKRTYFSTNHLDILGQYMTALPCALLAGVFVFKLQGGQAMVKSWEKHSFLSYHLEWVIVIAAFFAHLILHILALRFWVPRLVSPSNATLNVQYSEAASHIACNWFNSNPVQCLRSMHLHLHQPPHVYHLPGKEYLHKRNEAIHAYYEASHFRKQENALADVREAIQEEWSMVKESGRRLRHSLSGLTPRLTHWNQQQEPKESG